MWPWVDRLSVPLLDATLSATVLLCLVALAMLGCRQPARRIRLARAAILCSLGLIPLVVLAPLPRLDVVRALRTSEVLGYGDDSLPGPDSDPAPPVTGLSPAQAAHAWTGSWLWSSRWPGRAAAIGYLTGMSIGTAWFVLGCWGLVWLRRNSRAPSSAVRELYDSLPCERRRSRPSLLTASRVRRPVLVGAFRQSILIPGDLERPGAEAQLRLSLLHELAHAEHADPWFSLAANLAQVVWFFLPPLWWIKAQMRLDHEFLADRRAAQGFGALQNYASSLLELAAPPVESSGAAHAAKAPTAEGALSSLFQRVLMLVQCPFPVETRPPGWWCWSLPALVVMATLAASCLCLRAPGAAPIAGQPASVAGDAPPRHFRVSRLVITASPANSHGRAPLFELPIRLPAHFDLDVDVWGDAETLRRTRVAGHRLGGTDPTSPAGWHRVRVRRDASRVTVQVDDKPLLADHANGTTTSWLSVEPAPNHPGRFQNLVLSW
jgi:hypothetical protein